MGLVTWYMLEPYPYEKNATLELQGPKPGARRHQGGVDLAMTKRRSAYRCQKMAGLLGSIYPDGVIWPRSPIQLSPTKNWAFQTAALGLNPNFCGISSSTCGWKAFLSKMRLQDLGNIWHLREVTSKLFPSSEVCLARYLESPHPWDFRVPASPLLLCYSLNTFWDDTNDMTSKTTCYLEGCLDSWRMIHHM